MRQSALTAIILLVVLFASNAHPALGQTLYKLVDLGSGSAYSINENGQVVGSLGGTQAVIFDTTGQGNHTILGSGGARSINDAGHIVGNSSGNALDYGPHSPGGGYSAKIMANASYVNSINNNGQMVGLNNIGGYLPPFAVIFKYNATFHKYEITILDYGEARSNNDNDQIVGQLSSTNRAALWNPSGSGYDSRGLGTLSGYSFSEARSINNGGKIVGYAYNTAPYDYRAVLFNTEGPNIYLGSIAGCSDSLAYSINNNGQIVGTAYASKDHYSPNKHHAVLFDPTGAGNNVDLNTTLVNPIPSWTLTGASGINDNGWIVGTMYGPDQGPYPPERHAFLLIPIPEPTTLLLLGLGGLAMIRKRRK